MNLRPFGRPVAHRAESDEVATKASDHADAYVEALLLSRSIPPELSALDPEVRSAAELLRRSLVRFHPSFRFEEELAARLRGASQSAGGPGDLVRFPAPPGGSARAGGLAAVAPAIISSRLSFLPIWPAERLDLGRALERAELTRAIERLDVGRTVERIDLGRTVERIPRQVLMGGAIASGVSLAGVALVAWRLGRRSTALDTFARSGER